MTINLYMQSGRIGLKFTDAAARDQFWNSLSDSARAAAERFANRTIRFHPELMKNPNGLLIPLSGNGTPVPVAVTPNPATPAPAKPPSSNIVNLASTSDPFAVTGNATKALPGMVPVHSNIPQESHQEAPRSDSGGITTPQTAENASTGQGDAVAPSQEAPEPKPEAEKADPEPKDKRTRAYRDWWKRNHHGKT